MGARCSIGHPLRHSTICTRVYADERSSMRQTYDRLASLLDETRDGAASPRKSLLMFRAIERC